MENGGREREQGEEEDDVHQRNASDPGRDGRQQWASPGSVQVNELLGVGFPGPGWTANFRDCRKAPGSQSLAGWDAASSGAQTQESGWANFTRFQPFSG